MEDLMTSSHRYLDCSKDNLILENKQQDMVKKSISQLLLVQKVQEIPLKMMKGNSDSNGNIPLEDNFLELNLERLEQDD